MVNKRRLVTGIGCLAVAGVCLDSYLVSQGHNLGDIGNLVAHLGDFIGHNVSYAANYVGHKAGLGYILSPDIANCVIGATLACEGAYQAYRSFCPKPVKEQTQTTPQTPTQTNQGSQNATTN